MNILAIAISLLVQAHLVSGVPVTEGNVLAAAVQAPKVIGEKSFSLENRYGNKFVNDVFKDNILLTLAYATGKVHAAADINWAEIEKPQEFTFTLKPGEVFTFHEDVLPEYQGKTIKPTNSHFNAQDGFKSDGLYFGDGVCHIASLIYWAAKDAGLSAYRPARHDFAKINEVPADYGVSIYYTPGNTAGNAHQNLYVENNQNQDIRFVFKNDGVHLTVQVVE